jgi:tellurite resistance protein TehA-like permease
VLIAGGIGLHIVGGRAVEATASQSLHALGIIGIALGTGFLVSAIVSFIISQRLGLIEPSTSAPRALVTGTR